MTETKSESTMTVRSKHCKTLARLSRIAEQFLDQDETSGKRKDDEMMALLQRCLDILETYRDECKKLKTREGRLSQDELYETYESAYVYYKIVHNTVLNKVPNLKQFQVVKKQTNTNDRQLMEIYNMLVKSLLNDEKIGQIKAFLKENSKPDVEMVLNTGSTISSSHLQQLIDSHNDSTLLIDLRQRGEFSKLHINARNVICIEPISFKAQYTDLEIEKKSLITSPKEEIDLFRARDTFKFIVLYTSEDKESHSRSFDLQQQTILLDLLINHSFAKPLNANTRVYVLKAGFSNWVSEGRQCIGEEHYGSYTNGATFPELNSSIGGSLKIRQDIQEQPPLLSNGAYLSASSASSSPHLSPSNHYSRLNRSTQYPQTPQLTAGSNGAQYPGPLLPIDNAVSSMANHIPKLRAPRVFTTDNEAIVPVKMNGLSKPPSQAIPSLPKFPSRESSPALGSANKYDLDFAVGLENMGNSCYINCIVQCLLGTHELTNIFLNKSYERHINMNSRLGSKGVLAKYFAKLTFSMYQNASHKLNEKGKPVQPMEFKMACGTINSLFRESGQQDCQEFCQFLLDGLHEDLNQCGGNPPLKELSDEAEKMREKLSLRIASSIEWERFLTTDFSVIVDLFQGQYASQLRCQVCGLTSTTYQPFSVLSVPVPHAKSCNIIDCFKEFTKVEKLETDEQWSCPRCKKKQPSTKKLTITRLPRNLIIHLKRFDNMMNKNNVFVKYPFTLDLTPYWANDFDGRLPPGVTEELPTRGQSPPFNYKLYGVASHVGSLYGGHYTSYVDKGPKRGWCYFDDTSFRPVRNATECITPNAYVLFYHRVYQI